MNIRQVAALLVRIFSVWLGLAALGGVSTTILYLTQPSPPSHGIAAWSAASTTLFLGLSIYLWVMATSVGKLLVPRDLGETRPIPFSYANVERLVYSGLGLFFLIDGAPVAVHRAALYVSLSVLSEQPQQFPASDIADLARSVTELVLGLALFLGADVLQRLMVRLRLRPKRP